MDTFKKIYIALIGMTVLSFLYLGLLITGVMEVNFADETELYIFTSALYILVMSVIFSRAANVIANRKNRVVGYVSTVVGLVNLLILAIYMITHNDVINDISTVMTKINIYTLLMVLVFEIPQANTAHGKFQKFVAGLITITCIFPYITGLKDFMATTTSLTNSTYDGFEYNSYEDEDEEKKNIETLNKIQSALTLMSLAGFIVNPMLRVYYIDRDYVALHEMDDVFDSVTKYSANTDPNPNKVLSDKYKKDTAPQQYQQPPIEQYQQQQQYQQQYQQPQQQMMPVPMYANPGINDINSQPEELPREKVVNQKFQEEVHPEAIIPTIDGLDEPTSEATPNPLEEAIKPVEETKIEPTQPEQTPQADTTPNPLEAAIQPPGDTK